MTEIIRDIDKWNEDRLQLWIRDSIIRYQIADQSEQQAFASTLTILMFALAKSITLTDTPATEAGDHLVNAIDIFREGRKTHSGKKP